MRRLALLPALALALSACGGTEVPAEFEVVGLASCGDVASSVLVDLSQRDEMIVQLLVDVPGAPEIRPVRIDYAETCPGGACPYRTGDSRELEATFRELRVVDDMEFVFQPGRQNIETVLLDELETSKVREQLEDADDRWTLEIDVGVEGVTRQGDVYLTPREHLSLKFCSGCDASCDAR